MRRWVKWIGIVCLIPIVLVLLVGTLLYIPPVQNFAVKKAVRYASEATDMQIGIRRIRLSFPLNLTVQGIEVLTAPTDTLLTLENFKVRINPVFLPKYIVSVSSLSLQDIQINTGSFVEGMEIKGTIGSFSARADYIHLLDEKARLNNAILSDASIDLRIDSIVPSDTTSSDMNWILQLKKVGLKNISFSMQMPQDSLSIRTHIANARLTDGVVDLGLSRYTVDYLNLAASSLTYDGDGQEPQDGFDPMHIAMSGIELFVDSILYYDKDINLNIKSFLAEERSGLVISSLTGKLRSDSTALSVPGLTLNTSNSDLNLFATIPWSVLDEPSGGNMKALFTASLGKEDVLLFATGLPDDFKEAYPEEPVSITAGLDGNLNNLYLRQLKAELPGTFRANAYGEIGAVTDNIRRKADIKLSVLGENLDFFLDFLPKEQRNDFRIPKGIELSGDLILDKQEYQSRLLLTEDKAKVVLSADFHPANETYKVSFAIDSLVPIHFMPNDSLLGLTAHIEAEGKGFDFFKSSTKANITGEISNIQYGTIAVSDVTLVGLLENNQAQVDLKSRNQFAQFDISFNGTITEKQVDGILIADVANIDLYSLNLMKEPFSTSFQLFAEGKSDLNEKNELDVSLGNWEVVTETQKVKPKMMTLKARTDEDTTRVSLNSGDLMVVLTGNAGLKGLTGQLTSISDEVNNQLQQDSTIHITELRPLFPDMSLVINASKDNLIYNMLREYGIGFNSLFLNAYTSPEIGFRVDGGVYAAYRDTFLIDTIRLNVRPDSLGLLYNVDVLKNRYMKQQPFTAGVYGALRDGFLDAELRYANEKNETGLLLGVRVNKESEGIRLRLFPENPVIAYIPLTLNTDNYIQYNSPKDIKANVRLEGKDRSSLWINSVENEESSLELHAELNQIDLGLLSKGITAMPAMKGKLNADIKYAPMEDAFMVVLDSNIDELFYEDARVGELMLNAVYLPLSEDEHQVDLHFYRDREEFVVGTALYQEGTKDRITGNIEVKALPLDMFSPFIPDGMAKLGGTLNAGMSIGGLASAPEISGFMQLDSSYVYIGAAASRYQFDNKRIEIKDSKIQFDKYNIYAAGKNPFVINGYVDFSNLSQMMADLQLNARELQLLDARRTEESIVYGKLLVNLSSTLKGPLDALTVRGDLQLLGGTDITYILTESSLTVQDRLTDLVTFTSFADTLTRSRRPRNTLPLGGVDMLMVIRIDPAVQARVDLAPDRSSYVELEGGGDLSFQYTRQGDMVLTGRYTLTDGNMKYALPIIPLKEFHVVSGSYIQWDGDPMNPLMHLAATERVRANYTPVGGSSSYSVNFDVGVLIKERLEDMSLEFTIEAPENASVQNELTSLGSEERSKRAVTMMATGIYLGSTGSMNMGDALNSFLESEINNIAGSALKTVDISFGMDTYDQNPELGGGQRTDYSFRFAKRFYNDRIRVVVGGKISDGDTQQKESFIDNVSVEYRLDAAGSRNVKVFHSRTNDNLLDGEVIETGAGILLRRKMLHLRELFNFKKKKIKPETDENIEEIQHEE